MKGVINTYQSASKESYMRRWLFGFKLRCRVKYHGIFSEPAHEQHAYGKITQLSIGSWYEIR